MTDRLRLLWLLAALLVLLCPHALASGDVRAAAGECKDSPMISVAQVRVTFGALDPQKVRRWVERHVPYLLPCVAGHPRDAPPVLATFLLEIGVDGRVVRGKTKRLVPAPFPPAPCLLEQLKAIRFPAPPGGTTSAIRLTLGTRTSRNCSVSKDG